MLSTYTKLNSYFVSLEARKNDSAATAVEYALVIGLVSVVLVAALVVFGPKITSFVGGVKFGNGN